jgi:hypothetical protein
MPNLTSKKRQTINSNSLIKNQISNILQPVNGVVSIQPQPNNIIITQNAVSSKYYIPLLEKITGEQTINVRAPLAFNNYIVSQQTAYDIGKNWQNSPQIFSHTPSSICWSPELGLFCCGCNSNHIATSKDGLMWNIFTTGGAFGNSNDICWSPELRIFVVIAHNNNRCTTSPDGFTWTTRTSLTTLSTTLGHSIAWASVCWSRELGLFCAVGVDNIPLSEEINNYCVALSRDGINWSTSTSGVKNYQWGYVCWSAELGLFCAVSLSSTSTNRIMVSRDGYNWSNATNGNGSYNYLKVCWSPELGLFCATGVGNIIVSRDGYNWTPSISGVRNTAWTGVCWSRELGLFCAVSPTASAGNNEVIISRDGYNWTEATSGVAPIGWGSVCWSPELSIFCSVSYGTNTQRAMITSTTYRLPTSTMNTLSVPNVKLNKLPICNVDAINSYDLVNKKYVNKYVGFDLSGGDRWFCEDWIGSIYLNTNANATIKGTFNWNISNQNTNTTVYKTVLVAPNHIGVLKIEPSASSSKRTISLPVSYISNKVKSIRFIVKVDNADANGSLYVGFSDLNFAGTNDFSIRVGSNVCSLYQNNTSIHSFSLLTSPGSSIPDKWILYEITLNDNRPIFYIKNLTTNTDIINYTSIVSLTTTFTGYIYLYSINSDIAVSRNVYIDYIDWVVSS